MVGRDWSGQKGMNRWTTRDFWGCETILYDTVMMDIGHDSFVKTHRTAEIKEGTVM